MTLPSEVLSLFSIIGFLVTSYYLVCLSKALIYYMKFRKFPLTDQEQQIYVLQQENERLNKSISRLETETEDMTRALIQRLS